jgi:hypothetical protein
MNSKEKKIKEALQILIDLGLPKQQLNERSALTLLALLNLKPNNQWSNADEPLMGITPLMDFIKDHYDKKYAPNSRETIRRFTIHQFIQAALVVQNPDNPSRPTNSPDVVYQIEPSVLKLLRLFGKKSEWSKKLKEYLKSVKTLKTQYAHEREMQYIPLKFETGEEIKLSHGDHNVLIKKIIDEFYPRFTTGGKPIYVGDTKSKYAYFNSKALKELGVIIEEHGKMPDVVVYYKEKNWIILIEAVTSHGPVNSKRRKELSELFKNLQCGIVYVTAFLDRKTMMKHLDEISWETEVWIADSPSHLIHFNGERFLGPYE